MTYDAILPGATLLLRTSQFATPRKVVVLEKLHGRYIITQPSQGGTISCAPEQLEPLPERPAADPHGLTVAERRLYGVVLRHGPITAKGIAAIVNGNPEQRRKWTASTAGMLARRPRLAAMVKVTEGGIQVV